MVYGDADFGAEVMEAVESAAYGLPWRPELADEIRAMRERLEASRSERDLKRGFGGIVDVEFLVQLLQLKYGRRSPRSAPPTPGRRWRRCATRGPFDSKPTTQALRQGYDFLRLVESRLRIVHNRSLDELPDKPEDLEKLARRLGCQATAQASAAQVFRNELTAHTARIRELFKRLTRDGEARSQK